MATIEIDGKKIEADAGTMIIEVADSAGIYIPRFCYHKKLSIAANCRMCLVEVERSAKPLPACATPINDGMKIFTKSSKAITAQQAVMEFLLINHPLDCPVCDQGGECELQDLSMGYGKDNSPYKEPKRSVHDEDLGPLIATEMTRCILCTRCVRFGQEVIGVPELGVMGRGEFSEISTYVQKCLTSELSGNIIDLCPVGALTSKPFRFRARAWELKQRPSIAPHDCLGSHVYVHSRRDKVMRVVAKDFEPINETWLSDRDRFSYEGVNTGDRLELPMIKIDGEWESCDWVTAFQVTTKAIQEIVKQDPKQLGALISPSATTEEAFLFSKLMRALGSDNIDHRLHECDFADDAYTSIAPTSELAIADIETQDRILLLGSDIQREQPLAAHRIRKAVLNSVNAKVIAMNPINYQYYFDVNDQIVCHPYDWIDHLCALAKALLVNQTDLQPTLISKINAAQVDPKIAAMAQTFKEGKNKLIILGAALQNHPQAASLKALARVLATQSNAKLMMLTQGANSAGQWIAGCVPHRKAAGEIITRPGLNAAELIANHLKGYLLFNIEPEKDCANPYLMTQSLKRAKCVVAFTPYKTNYLLKHATILLPIVPFTETSGTFVNVEGRWQSFEGVVSPFGEARPGWKVLRVLANMFNLPGFEYLSSQDILSEVKTLFDKATWSSELFSQLSSNKTKSALTRIAAWPLYRTDNLVRHAESLQHCAARHTLGAYMNTETAQKYHLQPGKNIELKQQGKAQLPLFLDDRIPDDCVFVANGYDETSSLGESYGAIEVIKA
jgi:NADH-quinone oxidoreductase subunit G